MANYMRNSKTGKFEATNLKLNFLNSKVLSLPAGDHTFDHGTGFLNVTVSKRPHSICISTQHLSVFFDAQTGKCNTALQHIFGKNTKQLNLQYQENFEMVQDFIDRLNNPKARIV